MVEIGNSLFASVKIEFSHMSSDSKIVNSTNNHKISESECIKQKKYFEVRVSGMIKKLSRIE